MQVIQRVAQDQRWAGIAATIAAIAFGAVVAFGVQYLQETLKQPIAALALVLVAFACFVGYLDRINTSRVSQFITELRDDFGVNRASRVTGGTSVMRVLEEANNPLATVKSNWNASRHRVTIANEEYEVVFSKEPTLKNVEQSLNENCHGFFNVYKKATDECGAKDPVLTFQAASRWHGNHLLIVGKRRFEIRPLQLNGFCKRFNIQWNGETLGALRCLSARPRMVAVALPTVTTEVQHLIAIVSSLATHPLH